MNGADESNAPVNSHPALRRGTSSSGIWIGVVNRGHDTYPRQRPPRWPECRAFASTRDTPPRTLYHPPRGRLDADGSHHDAIHAPGLGALETGVRRVARVRFERRDTDHRLRRLEGARLHLGACQLATQAPRTSLGRDLQDLCHRLRLSPPLGSPKPVSPSFVSTFTIAKSCLALVPKSLVQRRSGGTGAGSKRTRTLGIRVDSSWLRFRAQHPTTR